MLLFIYLKFEKKNLFLSLKLEISNLEVKTNDPQKKMKTNHNQKKIDHAIPLKKKKIDYKKLYFEKFINSNYEVSENSKISFDDIYSCFKEFNPEISPNTLLDFLSCNYNKVEKKYFFFRKKIEYFDHPSTITKETIKLKKKEKKITINNPPLYIGEELKEDYETLGSQLKLTSHNAKCPLKYIKNKKSTESALKSLLIIISCQAGSLTRFLEFWLNSKQNQELLNFIERVHQVKKNVIKKQTEEKFLVEIEEIFTKASFTLKNLNLTQDQYKDIRKILSKNEKEELLTVGSFKNHFPRLLTLAAINKAENFSFSYENATDFGQKLLNGKKVIAAPTYLIVNGEGEILTTQKCTEKEVNFLNYSFFPF